MLSDHENDTEQVSEPQQTNRNINRYDHSVRNIERISDSRLQKNTEGMFECDQCESKYTTKGNLKTHIQTKHKHEGVKHACTQCDQQFTTDSGLSAHIMSIHEGVKHACAQCTHKATTKGALKTHIQTKHESIKYICNQCDHQLNSKPSLQMHIKSKH